MLSTFSSQQKISQDLSVTRRQKFLLDYMEQRSKTAAYLMLKTDAAFAIKKFDDPQILTMLDLLTEKTVRAEKFTLAVLASPRSDQIRQTAAERLYDFAGEPKPETYEHKDVLLHFFPQFKISQETATIKAQQNIVKSPPLTVPTQKKEPVKPIAAAEKKQRTYIVQEGDSLWKISRIFKVDVKKLKKYNQLESDFLKPGLTLKIPETCTNN